MSVAFELLGTDGAARRGRLRLVHGVVETPAFMPVGTQATVKALTPEMVASTGASIVLANTYHLMLRPGAERVARLGGLHAFMRWPGPILTDSGGFQVMSLAKLRTLDEALSWARHVEHTGRTPLLIEGDDGTQMNRRAIADALRVGMREDVDGSASA